MAIEKKRREVTISRVKQIVSYPSTLTLIAATNPCPCGYYGSRERYLYLKPLHHKVNRQFKQKNLPPDHPSGGFSYSLKPSSRGK
nr:ATP-binding protein [Sporosarcina sp. P33]